MGEADQKSNKIKTIENCGTCYKDKDQEYWYRA